MVSAFIVSGHAYAVPKPPEKVQGARSASGTSFRITWSSPTLRSDGNLLTPGELGSFKIIRSNALTNGTTVINFVVPIASAAVFTDTTVSGRTFYYRVRAVDSIGDGHESEDSTPVSSDINNTAYFMADDGLSFASVPGTLKSALDAEGSVISASRVTSAEGNRIYKSLNFSVLDSLTSQVRQNYVLSSPATLGIAYSVNGSGQVIASAPQSLSPAVSYPDAAGAKFSFSVYWDNGAGFVKLGSSVDTANRVATTSSRLPGSYQLRLVSQPLSAQLNAVYPRTLTPNSDGINDRVFFLFENPSQASASGSIFDAESSKVADLRTTDLFGGDTVLFWDGTDSNGATVAGGFYIYKVEVGDRKFSGAVAVAR